MLSKFDSVLKANSWRNNH